MEGGGRGGGRGARDHIYYIYIITYIHTHTHMHTYNHIRTYVCTYTHPSIHPSSQPCIHASVHACVHTWGLIDIIVPMSGHVIPLAPALGHTCVFLARTRVFHTCSLYDHELQYREYQNMTHRSSQALCRLWKGRFQDLKCIMGKARLHIDL